MELGKGLPANGSCMCKGREVEEYVLLRSNNGKACESGGQS